MLLGPDCLSGAEPGYGLWLQVSRKEGKNQTRLIGEVNSVQIPWQREQIPTYLLLYMSSQAHCHVATLPGSMCILLWGCNSMPPECYESYFALKQQ